MLLVVVVTAKLQVCKLGSGGVVGGMLGLSLGCHVLGGTNQILQILGDLVSHGIGISGGHGCGSGFSLGLICQLDAIQCLDAGTHLLLNLIDLGSGQLAGFFHTLSFSSNTAFL